MSQQIAVRPKLGCMRCVLLHDIVYFLLAAGVRINTDAAKRFVRNALWEAEQEAEQQQQQQQKGSGEGSSGKEGKKDNPNTGESNSSGDGGGIEEAGSGYSGGKKRKLDTEDTPNSDSTKRTRLE